MNIGVPTEIKTGEHRVGIVPAVVGDLVNAGHSVWVQTGAGLGINFTDKDYLDVGAKIAADATEVFEKAVLIVKVKEPQPEEIKKLKPHHILFTYLHLAPDVAQADGLQASGCTAIAYETVTSPWGALPLLKPMSEVAGRLSIQAGAHCLEKASGGAGKLLGGVPGTRRAKVAVLGGGIVGSNAIRMAVGMEAEVTVLEKSPPRLRMLDEQYGLKLNTQYATSAAVEESVVDADLVIGAVLVPGASAPKLVTKEHIKNMRPGSVVVDVAIDQGGCFETSRATTHQDPTYLVNGVVHYCVANMPGSVPLTATFALNNVTAYFIMEIANQGYKNALMGDEHLLNGLNVYDGKITHPAVAEALKKEYVPARQALS